MLDVPLVHSIDLIGTGLVVLATNDGIRYGKSNLWDYQSRARYAIIAYLSLLPRPTLPRIAPLPYVPHSPTPSTYSPSPSWTT
ncbi:hypothetical protein JCM1841_006983 [Sporobolomyces salmonicolor]